MEQIVLCLLCHIGYTQLYSNNKMADKSIVKTVFDSIKKNRENELFYKAFLTPIQIALKTHTTENDTQKIGCMPYGIKQVFKTSLSDNKFLLVDFEPIDTRMAKFQQDKIHKIKQRLIQKLDRQKRINKYDESLITTTTNKISSDKCSIKDLKQACNILPEDSRKSQIGEINHVQNIEKGIYDIEDVKRVRCDNLISLMKPTQNVRGIKIAICICMYSEDKSMLKRTLSGVGKNVETFVKAGYNYNDIGVFVVMDGIQVVHPTVQQYFDELQKENNIYLSDDIEAANMEEVINQQREMEDEEVDNFNHFIFGKEELIERKQRRFIARKQEYKTYKEMIKTIEKMEKEKNLTYESLNAISQRFFLEKARDRYKKDFAATDEDAKLADEMFLLENYAQNIKTSSPIIQEALTQTKRFCSQYVSTRDNLALLNSFRVPIKTATVSISESQNRGGRYEMINEDSEKDDKSQIKMNLFMITKYKNRGKLSSHNWFFNGFCQELKPQFAVLLDVGLVPEGDALYKMCAHMKQNPSVGGVCGYMALRIQSLEDDEQIKDQAVDCITALSLRLFDIQRAQQFEYHFAHLIDKPFESSSCFKFIHVLPGAFSAYRMNALRPQGVEDSKLLKQYFKSIQQSNSSINYKAEEYSVLKTICKVAMPDFMFGCIYGKPAEDSYEKLLYDENVYLAQDRTLCMGIHQNKFDLAYLPDAGAWVDPIKTLYGLLGQRKRWINGSFFAFEKVKETLQSSAGDCCLKLQIAYLTFMNWMSFVAPALFLFTIHIAMLTFQINVIVPLFQKFGLIPNSGEAQKNYVVGLFVYLIDLIYVLIFFGLVFYSMHLTNRQTRFKSFFYGVSTIYGIFSLSVFGVLIYDIISGFSGTKNAFLIENPWFIDAISGGESTINSLRYIMIAIMCLYVFPVLISLVFCKFSYIVDIVFSTFSFVFYSPTYLNILNIYALCRMDDISWGTKGLNSEVSRKKEMVDQWKKVKLMHVSKFVLYNLVAGFLLILYGNLYVIRFWLTFAIMIILGVTLSLKVFLGAVYLICYRITPTSSAKQNNQMEISVHADSIQKNFEKVKKSMYTGIENSILGIEKQAQELNANISPIDVIRSSKIMFRMKFGQDSKNAPKLGRKSVQDWQSLSSIQKKDMSNALSKVQKKQNNKKEQIKEQMRREQNSELDNTSAKLSKEQLNPPKNQQPVNPKNPASKKRPANKRAL